MGTTRISAPDGLPFIDIEREFDASPELLFRAHAEPDLVVQWLGPTVWLFEDGSPDETLDASDKMVTRRGRVVERLETWNDCTARLFAADVAEAALRFITESHREPFVAAISAARGFARGEVSGEERDAAGAAAWAAARDVQTDILFDYLEGRRS